MSDPLRRPLSVFVVWHPRFENGSKLADGLYRQFCCDSGNLAARAPQIPIRFRSMAAEGSKPPRAVDFGAERTAVIVLIDDELMDDSQWVDYLDALCNQCDSANGRKAGATRHIIVPVALTQNAYLVESRIKDFNFIRLHEKAEELRPMILSRTVAEAVAKLLLGSEGTEQEGQGKAAGPAAVKVFLSHAKRDGVDLTKSARQFLMDHTQLNSFFDVHDIPAGTQWRDVLREEAASARNALLVMQTDAYATREWCRIEVLEAKQGMSPMLVVHAISDSEERSFPYLGNIPVMRCNGADLLKCVELWEPIFARLMLEVVKAAFFRLWVQYAGRRFGVAQPLKAMPYPPELISQLRLAEIADKEPATVFVYPDPPLGTEEVEILKRAFPKLVFVTPLELPRLAHEVKS